MNETKAKPLKQDRRLKADFATVERARDLYEYEGMGPADVAREVGHHYNTVLEWLKYRTRIAG